jgi:hypothetical protein
MIPIFRLKKPLQPSLAVFGKFEQEFPFMTPMGNVPNVPPDEVSLRSCGVPNTPLFALKKADIEPKLDPI